MEGKTTFRRCLAALRAAWHPGLLLVALLLAGVYTLITYPGIWYSDSYGRAIEAAMIADGEPLKDLGTFLSVQPQFIIAACLELTSNFACYTWLQATLLLWAILEFTRAFFRGRGGSIAVGLLFMACPLIIGYSVYWETGAIAAICLLWLLMLEHAMDRAEEPLPWPLRVLALPMYGLLIFVMVGARLNAGTAAVGLLLLTAWQALRHRQNLCLLLGKGVLIVAATALAFALPDLLGMPKGGNAPVGPLWDIMNVVDAVGPGHGYDTCLDELFGEGATQQVMETPLEEGLSKKTAYGFATNHIAAANSDWVMKTYSSIIAENPGTFLQIKWKMFCNVMKTLPFSEYYYDRDGQMTDYRFSDTVHRRFFYQLVVDFMEANAWLRTPWLLFAAAGILYLVSRARQAGMTLWLALTYYGAFAITAQSFEFRYFFPACLLLLFSCLLSAQELLPRLWRAGRAILERKKG